MLKKCFGIKLTCGPGSPKIPGGPRIPFSPWKQKDHLRLLKGESLAYVMLIKARTQSINDMTM